MVNLNYLELCFDFTISFFEFWFFEFTMSYELSANML